MFAVWPGWDVFIPGLAGLPGAVSPLVGVSAWSVISVLRWWAVWSGWDVLAVWLGLGVFTVRVGVWYVWDVGRSFGGTIVTLKVLMSG